MAWTMTPGAGAAHAGGGSRKSIGTYPRGLGLEFGTYLGEPMSPMYFDGLRAYDAALHYQ
jgi:hypothetical protein